MPLSEEATRQAGPRPWPGLRVAVVTLEFTPLSARYSVSMSQANLEMTRRLIDAYNRGDVESFLAEMDPDIEWIPIMAVLEGRVYRGHDQIRGWLEDIARDWEYFEPCYEEYHDLGDRVLIFGRWRARARASGVVLENQPATWLYEVKDGKAAWMRTFTDRAEALEAAGLSPDELPAGVELGG